MRTAQAPSALAKLPAETLADALISLAEYIPEAKSMVERLVLPTSDKPAFFNRKPATIKQRKSFLHRGEA